MRAKTLNEVLDFDRSQTDPLKKLGIGIAYKKWREDHNDKPLFTVYFYLKDPMKNEYTYWVKLFYANHGEGGSVDTVYFYRERLLRSWGNSGIPNSLSNMQNKPTNMFSREESSFWDNPEVFNKIIDQLGNPKTAEKWFKEMTEEWFEDDFFEMMKKWFNSGVYRVDHTKLKFHG